ncbi:MAG: hypothetical protein R8G66_23010 [Cytophagales bacterium]|nr:hypothetical protein [Cytophagales bacterium]
MEHFQYFDEYRLKLYAEQIEGSPDTFISSSKIGGEISINPKLKFENSDQFRKRTVIEDMEVVNSFLIKKKLIGNKRPINESELDNRYFMESFQAKKVIVPKMDYFGRQTPEFTFWIGDPTVNEKKSSLLCLLENYGGNDTSPTSFGNASSYTLLQSLIYYTRKQFELTKLDSFVPASSHPNPNSDLTGRNDSEQVAHNVKLFAYDFISNTDKLLTEWGCLVSPKRSIKALYVIRDYGREGATNWDKVSVFGYPIWIKDE